MYLTLNNEGNKPHLNAPEEKYHSSISKKNLY